MPSGAVIKGVKDAIAMVLEIFESAKHEIVFLTPPSFISIAGTFDTMQRAELFIQNGGVIRGIMPLSRAHIEGARMRLDIGEDLRHIDQFDEIFMVGDRQQSISAINFGVREYTLDTPITAFWSNNPDYAHYLLTSFENVWSEAVPADERIRELLEQGPPQA